jgi:hypothetical protein
MAAATDGTRFEHAEPILRVADMSVSVRYYTNVLGNRVERAFRGESRPRVLVATNYESAFIRVIDVVAT